MFFRHFDFQLLKRKIKMNHPRTAENEQMIKEKGLNTCKTYLRDIRKILVRETFHQQSKEETGVDYHGPLDVGAAHLTGGYKIVDWLPVRQLQEVALTDIDSPPNPFEVKRVIK